MALFLSPLTRVGLPGPGWRGACRHLPQLLANLAFDVFLRPGLNLLFELFKVLSHLGQLVANESFEVASDDLGDLLGVGLEVARGLGAAQHGQLANLLQLVAD